MLGVWFLAASWGSKLAGILGSRFPSDAVDALAWFFLEQALLVAFASVVLCRAGAVGEAADGEAVGRVKRMRDPTSPVRRELSGRAPLDPTYGWCRGCRD